MADPGVYVPDGAAGLPRMDVSEFRRCGLLQELNRQFLNPLGLALETVVLADGREVLGGVWDFRDQAGGLALAQSCLDRSGERYVEQLRKRNSRLRRRMFGSLIQPIEAP